MQNKTFFQHCVRRHSTFFSKSFVKLQCLCFLVINIYIFQPINTHTYTYTPLKHILMYIFYRCSPRSIYSNHQHIPQQNTNYSLISSHCEHEQCICNKQKRWTAKGHVENIWCGKTETCQTVAGTETWEFARNRWLRTSRIGEIRKARIREDRSTPKGTYIFKQEQKQKWNE